MSDRDKAKIRLALSSRDDQINDAFERLYDTFSQSDGTSAPDDSTVAAAAKSLRDNYRAVSAAVARTRARIPGTGKLADGLADFSAAYDKLARGLRTNDENSANNAFDQMQALLRSGERKVSSALGSLRL
jgi:uncharacterized phage infection (PIP) family protein YhgE